MKTTVNLFEVASNSIYNVQAHVREIYNNIESSEVQIGDLEYLKPRKL